MSLLITLFIGGIVGWLAAQFAGREEGIVGSVVIGVIGAIIGGVMSDIFTGSNQSYLAFSWVGLFWAFIGSLILVSILNAMQGHHSSHKI